MYRIDSNGNVASLPAPATLGTEGYWEGPNPGAGVQGTLFDQDWFNMLQESLVYLLTQAALTHSKTDYSQLWQAINAAISKKSLSSGAVTPGWEYSPSGRLRQWALLTFPQPGSGTVSSLTWTYPKPFATLVTGIGATALANSSSTNGCPPLIHPNSMPGLTGTTFYADNETGVTSTPISWNQNVPALAWVEGF